MPNPPKSEYEKELAGTQRGDRVTADPEEFKDFFTELPPPPYWMTNPHALYEWQRLGPVLLRLRRLTEGNLSAFAALCAIYGDCVTGWANGQPVAGTTIGQYRSLQSEFVVPASARGRVAAEPPKANSFKALAELKRVK